MQVEALSRSASPAAAVRRCRVLLVEDNARLAGSIRDYLENHNLEVFVEGDGAAVAERLERLRPDIVLLDLMLPNKDGLTVCREIRRSDRTPILILTAKGEDIDQVLGLEMGADDYVVKPVEPRVLLARIEAILRRARTAAPEQRSARIAAGRLSIDAGRRTAAVDRKAVELTTGDFDILWLLASRQGNVVTRDEILRVVRGIDYDGLDRSIDARICRLRRKLADAGGAESMIKTVRLRGYLFTGEG
ncbi:response regulator transcription factor [Usitatibacter palustris]|uniref:Transcriptional regulatory protein RstA n=1 Tax=Usitatibacter palustris TaxID=2732487 RepID=A0A6M4H2B1_9PROT|nr:response regulator transcription factor [Usitatibacter palustris]QJR13472.1 Transcriptional regulatory protein RstA [Usitatibacter palustris]